MERARPGAPPPPSSCLCAASAAAHSGDGEVGRALGGEGWGEGESPSESPHSGRRGGPHASIRNADGPETQETKKETKKIG